MCLVLVSSIAQTDLYVSEFLPSDLACATSIPARTYNPGRTCHVWPIAGSYGYASCNSTARLGIVMSCSDCSGPISCIEIDRPTSSCINPTFVPSPSGRNVPFTLSCSPPSQLIMNSTVIQFSEYSDATCSLQLQSYNQSASGCLGNSENWVCGPDGSFLNYTLFASSSCTGVVSSRVTATIGSCVKLNDRYAIITYCKPGSGNPSPIPPPPPTSAAETADFWKLFAKLGMATLALLIVE